MLTQLSPHESVSIGKKGGRDEYWLGGLIEGGKRGKGGRKRKGGREERRGRDG